MVINFFFDVDGTILPFGKGMPKSAKRAMLKAQSLGHRLFLCTGRGLPELDPRLDEISFDGGVFSAGGYVEYKGKEVYKRQFNQSEKEYVLSFASKYGLELFVQTDKGTFFSSLAYDMWVLSLDKYVGGRLDIPNMQIVEEFPSDMVINKCMFFVTRDNMDDVKKNIDSNYTIVDNTVGLPQSMMAELVLTELTKASGIDHMLSYLGQDKSSAVAIGDGANDMEMVEYAGLGISMGNGSEALKAVADYVTTDIEDDGLERAIEYALSHLG